MWCKLVTTACIVSFVSLDSVGEDPSLTDWLVNAPESKTTFDKINKNTFRLSNGLIHRDFLVEPNFLTSDFYSHEADTSLLRSFSPECEIQMVGIRNISLKVGGALSDIPRGYLNRTDTRLRPFPGPVFKYVDHEVRDISSDMSYTPRRGAPLSSVWPPAGLHLSVLFQIEDNDVVQDLQNYEVVVHYEMYDSIPLVSKWVEVRNTGVERSQPFMFNYIEELQVNSEWSGLDLAFSWTSGPHVSGRGWLQVEVELPHGAEVVWQMEKTPVKGGKQPFVRAVYNPQPVFVIEPGQSVTSFKVFELITPTDSKERAGLARRRMMRTLAPWTLENPIFFHMTNSSSIAVRKVLDQMADVGFEMMIYSFGSGFDMESQDKDYLDKLKEDIAYANSLGIEVGGYNLIALTRKVKPEWMAINKDTNGTWPSACFASSWYDFLLNKTLSFMDYTGLTMVETDGPYGGYTCSSTKHQHHQGEGDSIYHQNRLQGQFYRQLRERGVYINQPDTYYLQGGNKGGMGYDEGQFTLPRWEDISISRQTVYDNTFTKPPSLGWMFMPLVNYEGGGEAAVFEPLHQNLGAYRYGLAQYLGAGVAACYRGYRLYDSKDTRDMVAGWVQFYKKYRDILGGDIIHVIRPTMQGLDAWLHVNPATQYKGLLMVFNPTTDIIEKRIAVPLYYTGIVKTALVSEQGEGWRREHLSRDYRVRVQVNLEPQSLTYYIFK